MEQLSANFTLWDLIKSTYALRNGIDNTPTSVDVVSNLALVCKNILEPVHAHFELPVFINSGYRTSQLNKLVGGKADSKHLTGQAVDFEIPNVPTYEVAAFIRDNLLYDQVILECYTSGQVNSGWVHCSYLLSGNRYQVFTYPTGKSNALTGLVV